VKKAASVDEPFPIHTKEGMSITTIVFDFGNVLGLFSHRKAAEQLAVYGGSAEAILAYFFTGDLEDTFELGRMAPDAYTNLAREACRLTCTDEQFRAAFADMFTPNEPVCVLVPHLKRRYRLLLLSNTNALHAAQFRSQFNATLRHFDALVLSHEVGLRKPDRRIYEHCRGLAGRPAHECLFIDDLEANVEAAHACGWKGLRYRPGEDLVPLLAEHGIVVGE
jgi:putative hydrolase of the HAD superfamily